MMSWLSCPCPNCGHKIEYIREQVGSADTCQKCAHAFVLPPNDGRFFLSLLWVSICAVVGMGLYLLLGIDLRPKGQG
jgi:uncharacterized protein (DUF983 family)